MDNQDRSDGWFSRGIAVYLAAVGVVLLLGSWVAIVKGSPAAAAAFAVLGGGALIVAPFSPYLEGKLRIGVVEITLRQRAVEAVKSAPVDEVEGILAILESDEIAVQQVRLPNAFEDRSLTSDELAFLRPDLKLSVIAIRRPGGSNWIAGGQIADEPLRRGTTLLVAGRRDGLQRFLDEYRYG